MKEGFIDRVFSANKMFEIDRVNEILTDYEAEGYDLSLRQLYYQFVSRNWLENSERSYKNLGVLVSDARLAGLIDWDMIKDRGRETISNNHWDSPADIVTSAARQFRVDKWAKQNVHVEVMVEKQALEGVLLPVCNELDISFSANKGYSSSSALYETGKRLRAFAEEGKELVVLYMGDHDPSGIDMSRDVKERLELFSNSEITLDRIALNMDQIRTLNPPENPAKTTDSRAAGYIARFGSSSWELDAIEPRALARLVTNAVESIRDEDLWEEEVERENSLRDDLKIMAEKYRKENES